MIPNWKNIHSDKEVFSSFIGIDNSNFEKCLEPSFRCTNRAINAHSVQNSKILNNLVRNGHVIGFKRTISYLDGPKLDYRLIGRNPATTFAGLCSQHDEQIFRPIEKSEINLSNSEHLFLFAYRAAYRELHATMASAIKLQCAYQERIRMGLDPKNTPTNAGILATERFMISYKTHLYKSKLDIAFSKRYFNLLTHKILVFDDMDQSTIAVCSLFSVDQIIIGYDALRIHLNVLPINPKKTIVIFSFLNENASHAQIFLNRILKSNGEYQRYELSKIILKSCENFVLSPSYFETWSANKKVIIMEYFEKTILKTDITFESPELYLF